MRPDQKDKKSSKFSSWLIKFFSFGVFTWTSGVPIEYSTIRIYVKISSIPRVYIILIFSKIRLENFNRFCFQLCKWMLLIVFNLLVLVKKKWTYTVEVKLFENQKFRAHFISPIFSKLNFCHQYITRDLSDCFSINKRLAQWSKYLNVDKWVKLKLESTLRGIVAKIKRTIEDAKLKPTQSNND